MKTISFTALVAFCNLAVAQEAPKIELEQTIHDFGNIAQFEILTGSFKVKNAGNAVLRMQQPSSSCGCAVATLKKDTLSPGETGEVEFTWKIGLSKGSLQRSITVASNDPQTPQLVLTIMANSKQLYDAAPTFLMAKESRRAIADTNWAARGHEARTDGVAILCGLCASLFWYRGMRFALRTQGRQNLAETKAEPALSAKSLISQYI
jgi:Protein of unknown function (DUF1573)